LLIKESGVSASIILSIQTGNDPMVSNNPGSLFCRESAAAFFPGWFSLFMGFLKGSGFHAFLSQPCVRLTIIELRNHTIFRLKLK
jgi:hypothetical protein